MKGMVFSALSPRHRQSGYRTGLFRQPIARLESHTRAGRHVCRCVAPATDKPLFNNEQQSTNDFQYGAGLPTPRIGGMGIVAGLIAAEGVMAPITE